MRGGAPGGTDSMPGVTVVIPNWNGRDLLETVLNSLAAQTDSPELILVVDNGSEDDSVEVAGRHGAEVVALDNNYGFARAVNEGLRRVTTPYVAVLNNDVTLAPAYLERLRKAMESESVDFATGCILQAGTYLLDGSFDLICRGGTAWRAGYGMDQHGFTAARRVQFVPMTAALFRTSLFAEVGYLDEDFVSYLEDVDFGLRCARIHKMGLYLPDVIAEHRGSASLGAWSVAQVRCISRNQVLLVAKHFPEGWIWRLGWPIFVAQGLWGLLAIRRGRGLAWLAGKLAGWRASLNAKPAAPAYPLESLLDLLRSNESLIRELGATRDKYWRWYFRLIG